MPKNDFVEGMNSCGYKETTARSLGEKDCLVIRAFENEKEKDNKDREESIEQEI